MTQTKIIPGYPALMIEGDKKSLVITDLHLGFESNLSYYNSESKLPIKGPYSSSENVVDSI